MAPLIEQIKEKVKNIVEKSGFELFDLTYRKEGKHRILRIVIDNTSGYVSVENCSKISREVSSVFDAENFINEEYFLEITSPGLDRPLRDWRDYNKFIGKLIRFQTNSMINNRRNYIGRIKEVNIEFVIINIKETGDMKFGYHEIAKAHLELEF
ncbi:ribosome maturation factor RimP [Candidatus Poribacteria bacterium]|nr:ribosome maturation factor RimP [Candidatus Poribacteria bacterium]